MLKVLLNSTLLSTLMWSVNSPILCNLRGQIKKKHLGFQIHQKSTFDTIKHQ